MSNKFANVNGWGIAFINGAAYNLAQGNRSEYGYGYKPGVGFDPNPATMGSELIAVKWDAHHNRIIANHVRFHKDNRSRLAATAMLSSETELDR